MIGGEPKHKMKRKALKNSIKRSLIAQDEPVWNPIDSTETAKQIELCGLLTWYSYNRSEEDARKYLLSFLKNDEASESLLEEADKHFVKIPRSVAFLSRILHVAAIEAKEASVPVDQFKGRIYSEIGKALNFVSQYCNSSEKGAPIKKVVSDSAPTIQDRIKEHSKRYLSEIDFMLDEFIKSGCKEIPNFYEFFQKESIKPIHKSAMLSAYEKDIAEIESAIEGKDSFIKEAYGNFTKKQLKSILKFYETYKEEFTKWIGIAKQVSASNRKPRIRKSKSPSKQVKSLKYLKEWNKFESVSPESIVGSDQVYLFNTKNKKIQLYTASSVRGFQVKGSTILDFDEKKSYSKKFRKPDEQIQSILDTSGKIACRKLVEKIKAKESKLTGRVNKDTIILKTFK